MLIKKTYVAQSSIPNAGMGLFADEDIKKGEVVWQYDPRIDIEIPHAQIDKLDSKHRRWFYTYCYNKPTDRKNYAIFCRDNARFANDSRNPNVIDIDPNISIAACDIEKGEEIFENYRKFGNYRPRKIKQSMLSKF